MVRKFHKQGSVFARWKADTKRTQELCLDHDLEFWKVRRFLKDDVDYENTLRIIKLEF